MIRIGIMINNKYQEEYNEVVRKYGSLGDELIIDELDTKDIKEFYKSLKL